MFHDQKQGFSQKGVQASIGRPLFGKTQNSLNLSNNLQETYSLDGQLSISGLKLEEVPSVAHHSITWPTVGQYHGNFSTEMVLERSGH